MLLAILGLVALGVCAQAAALLAAVRSLHRLELRLDGAERELLALRPRLERLGQIIEDVGVWTAAATEQLPRVSAGIEDTLDSGLPRAYTPELYGKKCAALFEHVYESYPARNAGVYGRPNA